jgi:hypothetical protein
VEIKGGAWKQARRIALAQKAGMDVAKTSAVLDCKYQALSEIIDDNQLRHPLRMPRCGLLSSMPD